MTVDQLELKREQAYFDEAYDAREEMRRKLQLAPGMAINAKVAAGVRKNTEAQLAELGDPDSEVAIGRVDFGADDPLYFGKHEIHDDTQDVLVVSWAAPAAEAFYRPTTIPEVVRKRTFESEGRTLVSFVDLVLGDLAEDLVRLEEPQFDDVLLDDLDRARTGEMQDIVRTIQAAQHELLTGELNQLLVVQGGPGTGKTAVALHRVVWLLFNHRDTLSANEVLVVGPNRVFMAYISRVLPTLGAEEVIQRSTDGISPLVSPNLIETPEVVALKGDGRMKGLLARGLSERIRNLDEDLEINAAGRRGRVPTGRIRDRIEQLGGYTYNEGRTALRSWLRDELETQRLDISLVASDLDRYLDRIWPQLTPQAFVRDLLGSEARLLGAAGDEFTAAEVRRLYRKAAERISQEQWSSADLPLLDHALHPDQRNQRVFRPHRRRRGPGPVSDATRHAAPPLCGRFHDDPRRHRPVDRSLGPR